VSRRCFRNMLAIVSLVAGLVGISSVAVDPAFALLFGVIAIVLGVLGLRRSGAALAGRGVSIAGIVLGGLSLLVFGLAALLIASDWPTVP
jgi:hypothetical protein